MLNENKLYLHLVCDKFKYLSIQIILFVLVLTLDSYDTPQNQWGVNYILRVSLILLCILMIFRFIYLNYSIGFIVSLIILSCCSIFYDELIKLLNHIAFTKPSATFLIKNHAEGIVTTLISILVIISLTSSQKNQTTAK